MKSFRDVSSGYQYCYLFAKRGVAGASPVANYAISVITEMELRSYPAITVIQEQWLKRFVNDDSGNQPDRYNQGTNYQTA